MMILGPFGRLLKLLEKAKDVVIARVNSHFAEIQQAIDANMDALEIDNFGGLEETSDPKLLEVNHSPTKEVTPDPADLSWPELRTAAAGLGIKGHAVKRPVLERRVRKAMANGSAI